MIKFRTLSQRNDFLLLEHHLQQSHSAPTHRYAHTHTESSLTSQLLELPLAIVQRADGARLEPARNAMEVIGMIADAPGHGALLEGVLIGICLAFNAQIHDGIAANGTSIDGNICAQSEKEALVAGNCLLICFGAT